MIQELIRRVKNQRKQKYFQSKSSYKYAFIGIGSHSINNLYPVINYFRLDLKYIVVKSQANAAAITKSFPNTIGTNDLDKVLKDDQIKGVFISTPPEAHFGLVKKVLASDKNVFVEKPPCLNLEDLKTLIAIEKSSKGACLVGLQKQYAPSYLKVKHHFKNKCSYNYRFVLGKYPEGNPIFDLFIHPLSLVIHLFGGMKTSTISCHTVAGAETIFLQLTHQNDTLGVVELSTDYSWKKALEKLIVNTTKGIYEITNTEEILFESKQKNILGIPKEKIFNTTNDSKLLNKRNNFNPIFENNQLFSAGYFNEIDNFVKMCNAEKNLNNSTLTSCIEVFKLIKKIPYVQ